MTPGYEAGNTRDPRAGAAASRIAPTARAAAHASRSTSRSCRTPKLRLTTRAPRSTTQPSAAAIAAGGAAIASRNTWASTMLADGARRKDRARHRRPVAAGIHGRGALLDGVAPAERERALHRHARSWRSADTPLSSSSPAAPAARTATRDSMVPTREPQPSRRAVARAFHRSARAPGPRRRARPAWWLMTTRVTGNRRSMAPAIRACAGRSTAEVTSSSTSTRGCCRRRAPGDRQPLALPARQRGASRADLGVVPLRQSRDEAVELRRRRCRSNLFIRGAGRGVADVVGDRPRHHRRVLRHDGDRATELGEVESAQADTVEQDAPAGRVVVAVKQVGCQRRLARARDADHRDLRSPGNHGVDGIEQPLRPTLVGERLHPFEADLRRALPREGVAAGREAPPRAARRAARARARC